jgi:carbon-monoxide dehydrogenase medium subunit
MIAGAGGRAGYIAGGTFLGSARQVPYDTLVDITGLGLHAIEQQEDRVSLGATVTIQDLAESEIVRTPRLELLARAARSVAGQQIRNMATVAGDLISGYLLADLPAALLVLGAELVAAEAGPAAGGDERRHISLEKYYTSRSERRPREWLVTEVVFPLPPPEARGAFIKFARTEHDAAVADVACLARVEEGRFRDVRLALSAAVNRPRRLTAAERFLEDRAADPESCRAAAERAMKDLTLLGNVRASRAYRAELVPVLIRRALQACAGQGEGGR